MKFGGNTNQYVREFLAETLGTFALVIFGDGAVAQVVLGSQARGDSFFGGFLNISFGYGLALMIGICISGGVSGGHLNPAVTLAMAAVKNLKPLQVPVYMAGQYLGAFLAALVLWGEYADAIKLAEATQSAKNSSAYSGLTIGIFGSYPSFSTEKVTTVSLAMDQMLGTALLPVIIGLGLSAIHLSFGLNAGSAINPARDFAPRLLSFLAGWKDAFKAGNSWFWVPWLLPHLGGLIGALVYQFMVAVHHP